MTHEMMPPTYMPIVAHELPQMVSWPMSPKIWCTKNLLLFWSVGFAPSAGAGMVIHGMRRKMSEHTGTTMATPADTAMNSGSPSGDTMPYSRA